MDISLIPEYLTKVDYVIHLAGENRPKKIDELKKIMKSLLKFYAKR